MPTALPQTNAELVSISADSGSEDYTTAASAPTPKWEGEVGAYVKRSIVTGFNESGGLNRAEDISIIFPSDLEPAVDLESGDTIVFEQWDPIRGEWRKYSARATDFATPMDLPSLPNIVKAALERVVAIT